MRTIGLAFSLVLVASSAGALTSVSPDERFNIVQKSVGNERWTIIRDADDGSIIGNVTTDTGEHFVWCRWLGGLSYECSGNTVCTEYQGERNCEWTFIANVDLPESFFALAAGGGIGGGGPTPVPTGGQPTPHPAPSLGCGTSRASELR